MTSRPPLNPNVTARIAGGLYLLLAVFGAFSRLYVPSSLFVEQDILRTLDNIVASEGLFRMGIVGALVTQVVQIATVVFLYRVLKPVNRVYALLMVVFVLLAVPIAMLNELAFVAPLLLLTNPEFVTVFSGEQVRSFVALSLDLHESGIMIAHVFWGLWLFPMGYLVYKSGYLPKLIGILLMIGCFGYLIDTATFFLLPDFGVTVSEFTFVGELLLPLWLVIKGVDKRGWEQRTHAVSNTHHSAQFTA